jgi:beta-phosphoglucomutase
LNTKIRAVIFDLDGVLVFTDRFHYQAWKKIADELKIPFDEQINNRLRGVSRMESLEIILEQYYGTPLSSTCKEALAEKKNGIYRELLTQMSSADVSDAVRDTLTQLKKKNCLLAVGSSSRNTRFILERVQLTDVFDAVADGTMISRSKPDPEVFLKAAELLKIAPGQCLVVEDADAGIEAGKRACMRTAAIGDAAAHGKADYILSSLTELLSILDDKKR